MLEIRIAGEIGAFLFMAFVGLVGLWIGYDWGSDRVKQKWQQHEWERRDREMGYRNGHQT